MHVQESRTTDSRPYTPVNQASKQHTGVTGLMQVQLFTISIKNECCWNWNYHTVYHLYTV